ncbi:MAG: DNA polymerase III subunit gamma/tau [Bacteroidia bacterium]|nr:DNA polymerase III subunit gamma/tau [Bacteroidia bacterium]HQU99767.1 DNA polymerase III subunit gamma/tau [Bacteroidia bacterium]
MNPFVVSARKYRPATFDSVVGQSHITVTLKNAIKNNHLAQAFLFCGPRGVGKTTCARILAKTINCLNINDNTEACNTCESCDAFNKQASFNIYELDAASNNSVEDIRALVEQVRYAPQYGKYKIYIIDEVHMLSSNAFNAFLKTLEEPPAHAIFILATTEKHKIIPTILSRCQIFDFNRIKIDDIAMQLQSIALAEAVQAEPEGLHIIAQKADGAMRDALSMFDQIVSFAGNTVTYKDVINNLNVLDYDYYFKITDQLLNNDYKALLLTYDELINEGFDSHHFINGLSGHFRDLLVCQDAVTLSLLEVADKIKAKYQTQASGIEADLLMAWIEICNKTDVEYRLAKNTRLHVELALLKMCRLKKKQHSDLSFVEVLEMVSLNTATSVKTNNPGSTTQNVVSSAIAPVVNTQPMQQNYTAANTAFALSEPKQPLQTISKSAISLTPSLKNMGKPKVDETAIEEKKPTLNQSFSISELHQAISDFAQLMLQQNKRNLAYTLQTHIATLVNKAEVVFELQNAAQAEDITQQKVAMLQHLKSALKNDFIVITTHVISNTDTGNNLYTPAEKFAEMARKNPALLAFKSKFDFDL